MDSFEKFYNSSLKFLSYRPRSEKEVRDNLTRKSRKSRKKVEKLDEIIDKVVNKLKEQNFINDLEFAKWWVEQRTTFKPRSVKLIKIELKQKGIDEEIIECQMSIPIESGPISNLEMAKKLVEKKIKRMDLSNLKDKQKLQRYLAGKGFDWGIIEEVLKDKDAETSSA